jgi:hypothetical protein
MTEHAHEWADEHAENIRVRVNAYMPSGSGVDNGTWLDLVKSTGQKLVFHAPFHHMDEHGFYDGWTNHTITVRPSLEFDLILKVSGSNRNDINSYLHDLFYECLTKVDPEEHAQADSV